MRFHVSMTSFPPHIQTVTLKYNQKIKIKNSSSGLKIKPIPGSDFHTFKRQWAFWPPSKKLL